MQRLDLPEQRPGGVVSLGQRSPGGMPKGAGAQSTLDVQRQRHRALSTVQITLDGEVAVAGDLRPLHPLLKSRQIVAHPEGILVEAIGGVMAGERGLPGWTDHPGRGLGEHRIIAALDGL